VSINDDPVLETEADVMGSNAARSQNIHPLVCAQDRSKNLERWVKADYSTVGAIRPREERNLRRMAQGSKAYIPVEGIGCFQQTTFKGGFSKREN